MLDYIYRMKLRLVRNLTSGVKSNYVHKGVMDVISYM